MPKQEKSQEVTQQKNNSKENSQPSEGMEYLMSPYYGMIDEVRVLLVDHDKEFVFKIVDLLESYKYKVTIVDLASTAMSMLSKDKERFDIMIINVHSPDLLSFQLLAQAVALDIVSIFVCDEHHTVLAKRALDIGAYLYLKIPLYEEFVKYMWQFVLRERLKKEKEREERTGEMNIVDDSAIIHNSIVGNEQVGVKIIPNNNEDDHDENDNRTEVENNNINVVSKGKYKVRRSKRGRKRTTTTEVEPDSQDTGGPRRKVCTEWTPELHAKFMKVVRQLGEGGCYPKEILELMNVPGLTRMQVASHLQKCRNNNWRVPEVRTARHSNGQGSSGGSQQRVFQRKFGSVPRLQTNFVQQQHQQLNQDQSPRIPLPSEFVFPPLNNTFTRGEISTEQHVYRLQLVHVEPYYVNIGNPVNNPLLSQINVGGLHQHTGRPYGMVGLGQGGPVIDKSAVYAPGLGDHVQDDYNMNVNMGIGTYSDSAMISNTNENMKMDGFVAAAANANFQQFYGEHNLSDPSMNFVASHASDSESESDERTNGDEYFDFNDVDYLFQNLGPPDNDLPNEQSDSEFDQVYSDDQVEPTPSIHFSGTTSSPDEEGGSEFDQVYSDYQVVPTPSIQFSGTTSFPDEQGGNEFDQVYSDDQVAPSPSVQFLGMESLPDEST